MGRGFVFWSGHLVGTDFGSRVLAGEIFSFLTRREEGRESDRSLGLARDIDF